MKTDYQKLTKHVRRKFYQYSPTLVHITGGQVYVILNQVPMSNKSHKCIVGASNLYWMRQVPKGRYLTRFTYREQHHESIGCL